MDLERVGWCVGLLGLTWVSACSDGDGTSPGPTPTGGVGGAGASAGFGGSAGSAGAGGSGASGGTVSCGDGVFPAADWEVATPESQGVATSALDDAVSFLESQTAPGGADELVVIRNGYLIWSGSDIDNRHEIYSATKTFTSTVLGLLIADGALAATDHAVDHLPTLDDDYPSYADVELRHLASMSAGYRGINGDCWSLHQAGQYDEYYQCVQTYLTPGPPAYAAGEQWQYNDPEPHLLGYVLTLVAGVALEESFRQRVADPIGMTDWDWSDYGLRDGTLFNNPAGTPNDPDGATMNEVQGGIYTSARVVARYGLLYVNRGCWDGQQLLSRAFVDEAGSNQVPASTPPAAAFDLTGRYGYYWWTNGVREDGTRPWPSAPEDAYTAHGMGGNFIFIVPSWSMVIVRLTEDLPFSNHGDPAWEGFFARLAPGVQ